MFSLKRIAKTALILTFLGGLSLLVAYMLIKDQLPSVASLKEVQWQTPMQIYSNDGKLINQFGEKKRIPLKLNEIPQQLINAILATEDDRFYLHFGVDPIGMARAILGQLTGQNKGGASTITMQVARNFFLTREQTYIRKLREIFTAFHIESLLTKDEILELYLNKIELGHRSFGFGAAAQVYYNKDVNDLTLAQIAVLAGLPKAPSTMNPISRPDRALQRRSVVLQRMLASGYISDSEYQAAKSAPITAQKYGTEIDLNAPYIAEMAHQEMISRYGKEQAYTAGYKVFTTVPSTLQQAAQKAVVDNIFAYDQRHGYRGVIKSLRPFVENQLTDTTSSDIEPLTETEISQAIAHVMTYERLAVAVVTKVLDNSVEITLKDNEVATIAWENLAWARDFINDDSQGPPPSNAKEILSYGDVIYVETINQGYKLSQLPDVSSALVSISPDNGAIKAVVGGFSFYQSQFNRVTQAKRQVGSNIKPFLYSAALDHGLTLASLVNDAPINEWDQSTGTVWRPKNSPPEYNGVVRVKRALAQSKNVVAVRLFRSVGMDNVIPHIASFGFSPDELPRNESLALGSASLTPLEVVTGFAVFANGGFLVQPYLIDRIEDSFGNIVYQANPAIACDSCSQLSDTESVTLDSLQPTPKYLQENTQTTEQKVPFRKAERVISAQNAFLITEALNEAIWGADWSSSPGWQGTGFRARTLKRRDIAGKTGTTNEAKDAWFSGYSRHLVATSWIGFDDHSRNLGRTTANRNLGDNQISGTEFGAKSAQPAWISFMETALEDIPVEPFEQPQNIVSIRIDKKTGKLTNRTDKTSIFEYFILGTEPTEYVSKDISNEIFNQNKSDPLKEIF
ncbi:PBP1A family penicillin-binding protein [Thalassotalea piscium]|uniref:Penicillin-binding protein 1A n=1 Tax=Thalassotalea piscium TaxID=1230533 RepID=A0A7X0NI52_9GAMM|nr:penicillin-binding protein 1A [Thalassotalea piscium]